MKYLLDTHAVIWYMGNSPKLPSKMKEIIGSEDNGIYLCSVSLWEIAIKVSLGKLESSLTFDGLLDKIESSRIRLLQIEYEHLKKLAALPVLHKDPFDRQLVAAALVENLTIITVDTHIQNYDVPWIW